MVRIEEADVMVEWDSHATAIRLSIDDSTPSGRAQVSALMVKADAEMKEHLGKVLSVVGFLAHKCQMASFTDGEMQDRIRLSLMLEDGTTTDTSSPSFIKNFAYLANKMGVGPWNPPLQLKVRSHKSRRNFDYYVCSEVVAPQQLHAGKRKSTASAD